MRDSLINTRSLLLLVRRQRSNLFLRCSTYQNIPMIMKIYSDAGRGFANLSSAHVVSLATIATIHCNILVN